MAENGELGVEVDVEVDVEVEVEVEEVEVEEVEMSLSFSSEAIDLKNSLWLSGCIEYIVDLFAEKSCDLTT